MNNDVMDTPMPEGINLLDCEPQYHNILVRRLKAEAKTKAGLYLPQTLPDPDDPSVEWRHGMAPEIGVVEKVPTYNRNNPEERQYWINYAVEVGDYVAYIPTGGVRFNAGGQRYLLIEAAHILAIV